MKVRRIDYYPDEYISGVGGRLSAVDQGIYWMVCSLIYSRCEPIDNDATWLARLFADTHWRTIKAGVDRLAACGKVEIVDGKITVKRCAEELQKARMRVAQASQNGRKGGRPINKNKEIEKPEGSFHQKLTNNYQPTEEKKEEEGKEHSGAKPVERSPSDPVLARETDTLYEYSDGEINAFQLEFDTIDVSSELEELVVWADRKGIVKTNERKSAIYGAMKRKHELRTQAGSLVAARENPPDIKPSSSLMNSRLVRRRPLERTHG